MQKINRSTKLALVFVLLAAVLIGGIRARSMRAAQSPAFSNQLAYPNPDAEIYATTSGISLEEALRLFRLQEAAGELQAALQENESDSFAGLWLEHVPEFKIVVLFTHDAEQKIKPYLTEELAAVVEARNVDDSRAMLEQVDGGIKSALLKLGIQVESELYVTENRITIFVNEKDRVQFDDALNNKQVTLPDNVEVVTVWELTRTGEAANPPSLGDHFPQLKNPPGVSYDIGRAGDLVLENGCLRLKGMEGLEGSFLLIWDARFSTRTEQGLVQVIDSLTGEVLASVGDYVMVGYGGDSPGRTWKPIPEECPGPYMVVGNTIKKIDRP